MGTPAVNGGTNVTISGRVIVAVMEAVTPISVETGIAMVAPTTIDTLAPTVGTDVCVNCACEEDCDDCDDVEATLLVDLIIVFKALPLHKCMHKQEFFPEKVY